MSYYGQTQQDKTGQVLDRDQRNLQIKTASVATNQNKNFVGQSNYEDLFGHSVSANSQFQGKPTTEKMNRANATRYEGFQA